MLLRGDSRSFGSPTDNCCSAGAIPNVVLPIISHVWFSSDSVKRFAGDPSLTWRRLAMMVSNGP